MAKSMTGFLKPSLNWLLVFIPVTLFMEHAMPDKPVLVFLCAALAIVPIASLIVQATEQIALRTGDAIGGLLNATFGNAPELIIAFVALRSGLTDMVRASLIGAILANLLLGLGLAFFLGGLRHHIQEFNPRAAGMQASMMMIAVISMMVPGSYHILVTEETLLYERYLNIGIAVVLLVSYALSLLFMIKTHPDFFAGEKGHTEEEEHRWGIGTAVGLLVVSSVLAAWMSEILVGAVEGASESLGVSKLFIGLVVLAVVGGAAELGSAVMMGRKNRMDLAMGIAIGSSVQIALFVAPLLVLLSLFAAPQPFVLAFTRGEITLVFMTLLIVTFVASGGKTHWYKGIQLLTIYLIFAILFFLIPGN
ncbi:MAG TPA: calcium/proton exchanger [Dissulfurispiraceae bacterium]|nr:calcium/proton exchanger [Dissulfurispiraceae bacterium]